MVIKSELANGIITLERKRGTIEIGKRKTKDDQLNNKIENNNKRNKTK